MIEQQLEPYVNLSPGRIALAIGVCIVLFQIGLRLNYERKVRRTGGVHASILAHDPFTAALIFAAAAKAQNNNRLLTFYNAIYRLAKPECPNLMEVNIFGGSRYFMTREPEHVKAILTGKFADFGKGPLFHKVWSPFLGDSIFTTDGHLWSNSRALIRPMFMKNRVSDLAIFEKWSAVMIDKIPQNGGTVDMMDLFYRMTIDVTTDFLLGHSVNSLEYPQAEFVKAFNSVQRFQMLVTVLIPFEKIIPRYHYKRGIRVIEDFITPFIHETLALSEAELEKRSNSDKSFTFLHALARFTRDPKMIRDQLIAVLLAGRDTTAATLSWAFYELSNYPEKYRKLRNEVICTVGNTRTPTYEDLKGMTYLSHILNETLRLYPAVPYNIRFATADTTLPGAPGQPDIACVNGDAVVYSTLSMQRRKDLYPPVSKHFADPAMFSPERWENWAPKAWQYIPFNGGPRICVGQNFALTEMAYVMVRMVQKYESMEYRGDWRAQYHKAEIVGTPGQGVPVGLFEATDAADAV